MGLDCRFLADLMDNAELVRNVAIAGHLHHGKVGPAPPLPRPLSPPPCPAPCLLHPPTPSPPPVLSR